MPNIITRDSHPRAFDLSFTEVAIENFEGPNDLKPQLYGTATSDNYYEKYAEQSGLGDFTEHDGTIDFDVSYEGYEVEVRHRVYTKGLQIQREAFDDEQYGTLKETAEDLGRSAFRTQQKDAADPFNNAFSLNTIGGGGFYTHSEGVALCSNSHTSTVDGVSTSSGFDNLSTDDFSATALETAYYTFRLFNDLRGEPIDETPDCIICPVQLRDQVDVVRKTMSGLDTAGKDANIQSSSRWGTVVDSVWFTDANNWFVANKRRMKRELLWIDRVDFEVGTLEAFQQFSLMYRAYMRYSNFYKNWRWVMGHQVA